MRYFNLKIDPLCFGDINEFLHPSDKVGGNDKSLNMISEFREALQDCNLVDLNVKDTLSLGVMVGSGLIL